MAKEIEEKKNRRKFFAHVKTKRTAKREQIDDENSNVIEVTPGKSPYCDIGDLNCSGCDCICEKIY